MAAHCCQLYIHEKTKVDFVVFRGVVFISNLVAQRREGATKHLDDTYRATVCPCGILRVENSNCWLTLLGMTCVSKKICSYLEPSRSKFYITQ